VIPDSSDYAPYLARFIADQDWFDFFEVMENEEDSMDTWDYFGDIFQCPDCHNLILFTADYSRRCDFQPLDKEKCANITISYLGDKWKGILRGHYYGSNSRLEYKHDKGELYWQTNQENGYLEDISLEDLRKEYYKKFEELRSLGILRSAFLRIDGHDEHSWGEA